MSDHHPPIATAFIGIGSNIHPLENMRRCMELLTAQYPSIRFSSVYQSKAQGYADQDDFLNAVATIETDAPPKEVHKTLKAIENDLGKNIAFRNGPRTIDLDLLLYNDLHIETDDLIIPHPRMHGRRFVLEPLCELTDDAEWKEALKQTSGQECVSISLS